jgi:hypothetical protein
MNWSRTHRWKLTEWHPWVLKGAAVVHVAALTLMGVFLTGTFRGTQTERMYYIAEHETAVFWSWASWMFATLAITLAFYVWLAGFHSMYRPVLQMALLIWIIGAATEILHDLIQMTIIPALSELFLQMPSPELAGHFNAWDRLLIRMTGVFSNTCYAISGLISTGVMFQNKRVSNGLAGWSLFIWALVLLVALCVGWLEVPVRGVVSISLLLFLPWAGMAAK